MAFWKPVVVGVDSTPESAGAAAKGWNIAAAADTSCFLVHGMREVLDVSAIPSAEFNPEDVNERLAGVVHHRLTSAFLGEVPPEALDRVEVRLGNPTWALRRAVQDHDAGLLVLGGKHHAPPANWRCIP